ncbi:MAG: hypothetical protein PHY26_00045 [Bacilli bacterium]|nr:hypothetical protein [Bacilli bacterium]
MKEVNKAKASYEIIDEEKKEIMYDNEKWVDIILDYIKNINHISQESIKARYFQIIDSFLSNKIYNPNGYEQELEVIIKSFIEKVIIPNFQNDITIIYASSLMVAIKKGTTDFVKNNQELFTTVKELFNIDNNLQRNEIYNNVYQELNDLNIKKLINYVDITTDQGIVFQLLVNGSKQFEDVIINNSVLFNSIDIERVDLKYVESNIEVLKLVINNDKNIKHICNMNQFNIHKNDLYKLLNKVIFSLSDLEKTKILANPKLIKLDFWYVKEIFNSISNSLLKIDLIISCPSAFRYLTENYYINIFSNMEIQDIKILIDKIDFDLITDPYFQKVILGAMIGVKEEKIKEVLFKQTWCNHPDIITKTQILLFIISIKNEQLISKILLNEHIINKLNIFDYAFILGTSNLSKEVIINILTAPELNSKYNQYNLTDLNLDSNDLVAILNNKYIELMQQMIKNKEINLDLINSISIAEILDDKLSFFNENIDIIMRGLLSKEYRSKQLEIKTMYYILEKYMEYLTNQAGINCICRCLPTICFNENEQGEYSGNYIKLNQEYIKSQMINNIEVLITINHEKRHVIKINDFRINDNNIQILWMLKDYLLTGRFKDREQKLGLSMSQIYRNYQYFSYESDARCASVIDTIKYLKEVAPDIAEFLIYEYTEKLKEDIKIKDNKTRIISNDGEIDDLDSIFNCYWQDLSLTKRQKYLNMYPILKKEYNDDGTRKDIVELIYESNIWSEKLRQFHVDKELLRSDDNLLMEYSLIKKNITFYTKLIKQRLMIIINDDNLKSLPSQLTIKLSDWEVLSSYDCDEPSLKTLGYQYLLKAMIDFKNFIKINDYEINKPILLEIFTSIYNNLYERLSNTSVAMDKTSNIINCKLDNSIKLLEDYLYDNKLEMIDNRKGRNNNEKV